MSDSARLVRLARPDINLEAGQWLPVSNDLLRGKWPVPLKALERCVALAIMSLPPEGWNNVREWVAGTVEEGEKAVKTALVGLETKGYLARRKARGQDGTWVWSWEFTADPITQPLSRRPETALRSDQREPTKSQVKPSGGNPPVESRSIIEDGPVEDGVLHEDGSGGEPPKLAPAGCSWCARGYTLERVPGFHTCNKGGPSAAPAESQVPAAPTVALEPVASASSVADALVGAPRLQLVKAG